MISQVRRATAVLLLIKMTPNIRMVRKELTKTNIIEVLSLKIKQLKIGGTI